MKLPHDDDPVANWYEVADDFVGPVAPPELLLNLNWEANKSRRQMDANAKWRAKNPEKFKAGASRLAKAKAAQSRQELAKRELARRTLARKHLLRFIQRFNPDYKAGWAHELICRRLESFVDAVARGESPRLMLFCPPRFGKSLIASQCFPAWALGNHPNFEIISASYGSSLPMGFSRKVRAFLRDKYYQKIFTKTRLDRNNENVEGWLTTKGGGYVPAGVGGGITGKGAHILIVDDPVKDAEQADSETVRESTWDWWGSTAYTRLAPGGGVLVIQTRWHDDDLSGRLIQQMHDTRVQIEEENDMLVEALKEDVDEQDPEFASNLAEIEQKRTRELAQMDNWEIINFPAVATADEWLDQNGFILRGSGKDNIDNIDFSQGLTPLRKEGEALHPQRFPLPRLNMIKRQLQPRHWSALYQQNPVPDEGSFFTKDMFRYRPNMRRHEWRHMHVYQTWDLAVGMKQQNDYTVGITAGLDYDDKLYILNIVRFKGDTHAVAEAILKEAETYREQLQMVGIEKGQLELAIKPQLEKLMKDRKFYPTFAEGDNALKPVTDKMVRARPLQGRMQQGMVIFPENQPWVETVQHELLRFPGGVHDDIVDSLAWMVRMVSKQGTPRKPKTKKHKSWRDKLPVLMGSKDLHPMGA